MNLVSGVEIEKECTPIKNGNEFINLFNCYSICLVP